MATRCCCSSAGWCRARAPAWFVGSVLPALCAAFPALRLVIVGNGPERPMVKAAAREQGLADRITLAGTVGDGEKWSLLARCDAVVVPNLPVDGDVEGFGIVALEAGAAGKVVFAADLEGLRDAVADGVNGWRLPAGDAVAWTRALAVRLDDRRQLLAQGELAREHVRSNFDWDAIGERYAAIIERFAQPR
jgi:glycosyltransferase involved in cell wall biosynthesis